MTAIAQALNAGHSTQKILKYLAQQNPELAAKISGALEAGHTIDHILNFISKNEKRMGNLIPEKTEEKNPFKKIQTSIHPALTGATKALGTAAGAIGGGYALSRAIPSILQRGTVANAANAAASAPDVSGNAQQPPLSANQSKMQPSNVLQDNTSQLTQQPPVNQTPNNVSQDANIEQPKEKTNIAEILWKNLEKGSGKSFGFESDAFMKVARRMKSTGEITSPEEFQQFFNLFDQKQKEGKGLPTALKEASAEYSKQKLPEQTEKPKSEEKIIDLGGIGKGMTDNLYNGLFESLKKGSTKFAGIEDPLLKRAKEPFEKGLIKSPEDLRKFANEKPIEQPKIEKKSIVSSPQGVGEVKEIRNGQAIIDVDGKLHKVKKEELEASPLPEKELDELYDDLIKGIEAKTGEDVSRMVQWAGYNPETNTLQFLPHTGKLYKYGNISEEDAALLTDILSTRKTTGENFIGAWKAGSKSPIGAALSKLIRKLQSERGGKGNEYEETHEPIYSAYEPAIEAKKRRKKKK